MNFSFWVARAGEFLAEGETPTPRPTFNPDNVGPGIESFIILFILAVAGLGLVWSMMRHLRRVQVRAKLQEAEGAGEGTGEVAADSAAGDSVESNADSDSDHADSAGDPDDSAGENSDSDADSADEVADSASSTDDSDDDEPRA